MTPYLLSGPAKRDLSQLWDYIARDNPTAADRLVSRLGHKFNRIAEFPDLYSFHLDLGPPIQYAIVKPYVILFRKRSQVEILRVIHGARDLPSPFPEGSR